MLIIKIAIRESNIKYIIFYEQLCNIMKNYEKYAKIYSYRFKICFHKKNNFSPTNTMVDKSSKLFILAKLCKASQNM